MLAQHRMHQMDPAAYLRNREDELKAMPQELRDSSIRQEDLVREARMTGNQGNLVAADGKMVLLSDEAMGGTCDTYSWGQNETEVTVKAAGPPGLRGKEVKMKVTSDKLRLEVRGVAILDGELFARVIADEATFVIEDAPDGGRLVVVSLTKLRRTMANGHWKCVVKGEPEIDTDKFGPQVRSFDPNDAEGMSEMFSFANT